MSKHSSSEHILVKIISNQFPFVLFKNVSILLILANSQLYKLMFLLHVQSLNLLFLLIRHRIPFALLLCTIKNQLDFPKMVLFHIFHHFRKALLLLFKQLGVLMLSKHTGKSAHGHVSLQEFIMNDSSSLKGIASFDPVLRQVLCHCDHTLFFVVVDEAAHEVLGEALVGLAVVEDLFVHLLGE